MNDLEIEAKPLLIGFIEDAHVQLKERDQEILARWIVMKAIVSEHSQPGTQVTPRSDRVLFKASQEIPAYFEVYIGRHQSGENTAYLRHSLTISRSKHGPSPPLNGLQRNTQSISFLCGHLFVHVIAARVHDVDIGKLLNFRNLDRIWPCSRDTIAWPPEYELASSDMEKIVYSLEDLVKQPNVVYGGDPPES